MLPFLKERHEGSTSGPVDVVVRDADDPESFDLLDAIVKDMMQAFHSKDEPRLRDVLEAFAEHLLDLISAQESQK